MSPSTLLRASLDTSRSESGLLGIIGLKWPLVPCLRVGAEGADRGARETKQIQHMLEKLSLEGKIAVVTAAGQAWAERWL